MNEIQHICEPDHLILTWQSPDLAGKNRKRYGVADLYRVEGDAVLIYRDDSEVSAAEMLGYTGYPAFRRDSREHKGALSAFKRRLPPRGRSDFSDYLKNFRLHSCDLSDFALLAYTEAKLPSDGFALVSRLDGGCVPSEYMLEIAGFRHYLESSEGMAVGDELEVSLESENPFDSNAVALLWNGAKIGNVNRFQVESVARWLKNCSVSATFERRNGSPERPRGYVFVKVR